MLLSTELIQSRDLVAQRLFPRFGIRLSILIIISPGVAHSTSALLLDSFTKETALI